MGHGGRRLPGSRGIGRTGGHGTRHGRARHGGAGAGEGHGRWGRPFTCAAFARNSMKSSIRTRSLSHL